MIVIYIIYVICTALYMYIYIKFTVGDVSIDEVTHLIKRNAFFARIYTEQVLSYQARLGTNIGRKAALKKRVIWRFLFIYSFIYLSR